MISSQRTMASSTLLFFLSAVIMHLSLTTAAQLEYQDHACNPNPESSSYSVNSDFAVNLKHTLSSLIANASTKGFYNLSIGQSPEDRVYGLFQCRGDIVSTPALCRSCIEASSKKIVSLCPYQKEAIIWYDLCMLRYTNRSIFGIMEKDPAVGSWATKTIMVDKDEFNATFSNLMEGLISKAVSGSGMFATGDKAFQVLDLKSLYGLVQWTRDITQSDCYICLQEMLTVFINDTQIGGRAYSPSCNARYEWYCFDNDCMATPSPPTSTNSPAGMEIMVPGSRIGANGPIISTVMYDN